MVYMEFIPSHLSTKNHVFRFYVISVADSGPVHCYSTTTFVLMTWRLPYWLYICRFLVVCC